MIFWITTREIIWHRQTLKKRKFNSELTRLKWKQGLPTYTPEPLENREWTQVLHKGSISCSTSGTRRVKLVTNLMIGHEWGMDREVLRGGSPSFCLFFFDIRILITPLVSSNSSRITIYWLWKSSHLHSWLLWRLQRAPCYTREPVRRCMIT
jgi:hypothetical protein